MITRHVSESNEQQQLGFDDLIGKLRDVVARLEEGNLSLEDSLKAYEEGIALARRGHDILDRAEKRVELLVSGSSGQTREFPVDTESDADGEP